MERMRRPIIKIGGRKGELRHCQAYYSSWHNEIVLKWPWWQKQKHLEKEIAETIEYEVIHHVLEHRIGEEASLKYDKITLGGIILGGLERSELVPCDKFPKRLQDRVKRNLLKTKEANNQKCKEANAVLRFK